MAHELKLWSKIDNILYIKGECPTNQKLSVELQVGVAIWRSFQESQRKLIHLQRCLLYVPFGSYVVPLLIVQRDVGLDSQDQGTVSHIQREHYRRWS